ncbi:GNAT family N-acetyltransferase [Salarchaeum sp. III]|uniref:GNAT family N-acetyltransferase n=1 Tax=Salarchaeum sp. III TaxID=3107927 RepID=UPI002ED7DFA7
MSDSLVRDAARGDAARVREIAAVAWRDAHAPLIGEERVAEFLAEHYTERDLRNAIASEKSAFLVAEREAVVGFVEVGPVDDPDTWSVYRIYVHPEHYGAGVGTALLDAAESRLPDSVSRLRLVVLSGNDRARRFYEARGFEFVRETPNEFDTRDAVYAKRLDGTV